MAPLKGAQRANVTHILSGCKGIIGSYLILGGIGENTWVSIQGSEAIMGMQQYACTSIIIAAVYYCLLEYSSGFCCTMNRVDSLQVRFRYLHIENGFNAVRGSTYLQVDSNVQHTTYPVPSTKLLIILCLSSRLAMQLVSCVLSHSNLSTLHHIIALIL